MSLPKPDVDKITQLIRTRIPNQLDLVSEIKKDMKEAYLQDNRNKFDFYNVKNNIVVPKKIVPKHLPQNFQSVHHITNPETRKRVQNLFQEPQYNALQTQAIKEIQQGGCRVHVLSDIYKSFTASTEPAAPTATTSNKSQTLRSKSTKQTPKKGFEATEVEDLENWTYQKISGTKIRHNHEIEELKKEVNRMMLFIEEDCVTQGDKSAMNCMFDELAVLRTNERFAQSVINSDRQHHSKSLNELPALNALRSNGKNLTTTPQATIRKGLTDSLTKREQDPVEATLLVDSSTPHARMDLKSRLNHYKSMHEQVEIQLKFNIQNLEKELEKRYQTIKSLEEENQRLEDTIAQNKLKIEEFKEKRKKSSKRAGVTFLPGLVVTAETHKRAIEERDSLKIVQDEIVDFSAKIPQNEFEIRKIEAECNSLSKKLQLFRKVKSKLYLKILKHGLDCRSEGLVWVLVDLMQEGEIITYDDLPEFLDTKSKSHLMQKCKLLNQLKEMKASEKVLIDAYKTSFEGNFYNSRFATLTSIPKSKPGSLNNLANNNNNDRKIKTFTDLSMIPKNKFEKVATLQSLNDLDLDLDMSNEEENSIDQRLESRQLTSLPTKSKASSLAHIQEENEYGFNVVGAVDVRVIKKEKSTAKMMSLNDISAPRQNFNENVYQEAKDVVGRLLRTMKTSNQKTLLPATTKTSPRAQLLKMKSGVPSEKEEKLARIQELQSRIDGLIDKINNEDNKEGARMLQEYNPQKIKIDLEFYLACVLGLAQAEKFFYKYSLKNVKSSY